MPYDFEPLGLTFKLAALTTIILFLIGVPLAYWLTLTKSKIKYVLETIVSMPLVLPPTVLGFYLLIAFSPRSALGNFLETSFDIRLAFTFTGILIGSIIFSLPFMVNPIKAGLENLPGSLAEAAYTLGKSKSQTLFKVLLPNIRSSILAAVVMTFAHTLGEFGVVLMIGGNIPHVTRVASIAIYSEVEAMNYRGAHFYSLVLIAVSFFILLAVHWINRKQINTFV